MRWSQVFTVNRVVGLTLLLLAAAGVGGCAAGDGGEAASAEVGGAAAAANLSESFGRIGEAVSAGSLADNGLEVRAWIITDDAARIARAFTATGDAAPMNPAIRTVIERNGFRVWRVPIDLLSQLRDGFGGTTIEKQSWFGQIVEWSELHDRSLGGQTRGISIEGSVRRFRGGSFQLLVRAWTMATEDGPRMQFEMVPFYAEADAGGFRRALNANAGGESERTGEVFPRLLMQTSLEAGYAYVLTCERPEVDWEVLATATSTDRIGGNLTMPAGGDVRGNVGPPGAMGPEIGGPWTIGEALLQGDADVGSRGVIVLIPRIPDRLFPPEEIPEEVPEDELPIDG